MKQPRPLIGAAQERDRSTLELELAGEQIRGKQADRDYWEPLRAELEQNSVRTTPSLDTPGVFTTLTEGTEVHTLIDLGGAGPLLHLAPANSFPLGAYRPMLEPLSNRFRVVALPPRALWPDPGPAPAKPTSWETLGEDIAAGMVEHDLRDVLAVGHSFGAVASLVAAVREPERFRALVLLDPTLLLQVLLDQIFRPDANGVVQHQLAVRARTRRAEFASLAEAFEYWRPRSLFRDWSDEALWFYVRSGLRPLPNGAGFTLVWAPDWEANYYEGLYRDGWRTLDQLDPRIPVLLIRGGTTDTFSVEAAERFRQLRPSASVVDLPGFGHLFPLAAPDQTARMITDWFDR